MDGGLFSVVAQLLITTCVVISCAFFYHNYSYWKNRGVPYEKPFLIFGNLGFLMRKSFWDFCYEIKDKHPGDYVGIFLAWRPVLFVQTPELTRRILVQDHDHFQDRFLYSRDSDLLGSLNLFTLKNPMWSTMRYKITPMFTGSRLKNYTVLMNMNAKELVRRIKRLYVDDNKPVNLMELFLMYTSDTIAYTVFGIRVSALSGQKSPVWSITKHMVKWTFWRGFEFTMIFLVPAIASALRLCFFSAPATEYVKSMFWTIAKERKNTETSDNKDLVNYLLKLKENLQLPADSDSELADNLMLAQAAVFILGAIQTSSVSLSYALHELSHNPEAQEKLYLEVRTAVEKSGKEVLDYDELMELTYLTACIHETLRMHTPIPYLERVCSQDYKLSNELTIEKGIPVLVNLLAMHYDKAIYPEPHKWRPERMIANNNDNLNFNFLTFGEGPRYCIGKRYGMMQIRAALAQVIIKFKLEPAVPHQVENDPYSIILAPKNGLSVKFIRR